MKKYYYKSYDSDLKLLDLRLYRLYLGRLDKYSAKKGQRKYLKEKLEEEKDSYELKKAM